jgi:hypothetical protein
MKGLIRIKVWDDAGQPIQEITGKQSKIKIMLKDLFKEKM